MSAAVTTTLSETYVRLLEKCPLRPIKSDEELVRAIAVVDSLTDRDLDSLDPDESDYLDVLAELIHAYEAKVYPLVQPRGVEAIRMMMQLHEMTQTRLAEETGLPMSTLSEVLAGRRGISPKVRTAIAKRFKMDPAIFVD